MQSVFRRAWESRILLAVARASYVHVQLALTKLLPQLKLHKQGPFRRTWDPLLNAGVFELRSAPPSAWDTLGAADLGSPFD